MTNFEQGAYLVLLEIFPNVDIEGCFFHISKRLDYKVKELGLMAKYQDDYDFRFRMKKLSALAFIPVEDLIMVYEALADTFEEDELELISYFEATWIVGVVGRRQRRTLARFPAAMWNVAGRHFTASTRTTIALEAIHHSLNSLVACQHPSIWVLLKSLQRQQALINNMLSHIAQGETKLPGTRERERERESTQC